MCMSPFFGGGSDGGRGMHIEATWHKLTDGTWYMDQVTVPRLLLVLADGRL